MMEDRPVYASCLTGQGHQGTFSSYEDIVNVSEHGGSRLRCIHEVLGLGIAFYQWYAYFIYRIFKNELKYNLCDSVLLSISQFSNRLF